MTLIKSGNRVRVAGASRWRRGFPRRAPVFRPAGGGGQAPLPPAGTAPEPEPAAISGDATARRRAAAVIGRQRKEALIAMFNAGVAGRGIQLPESEYRFAAVAVGKAHNGLRAVPAEEFAGDIGKGLRRRLRDSGLQDWRFDFAWANIKLAVEVDGGAWTHGRHTRGQGFIDDQRKRNAAILLGWRVLHYTPQTIDFAQIFNAYMAAK